jgi:hypothetical protein
MEQIQHSLSRLALAKAIKTPGAEEQEAEPWNKSIIFNQPFIKELQQYSRYQLAHPQKKNKRHPQANPLPNPQANPLQNPQANPLQNPQANPLQNPQAKRSHYRQPSGSLMTGKLVFSKQLLQLFTCSNS